MTINSPKFSAQEIESKILDLLSERRPDSSICPSDAARALSDHDWRDLMPLVREVSDSLAQRGQIVVTQKGRQISSAVRAKGPIRLKLRQL